MRTTLLLRLRNREHGAAAVEFGLVAVVLLTLIIGIIQFAIYFWAYQVGAHAAREGARLAAVAPCIPAQGAIVTRVVSRVGSAADGAPVVTVTPPATIAVGQEIEVSVSFDSHEIGGLLPPLPAISKSAISRIEYIPGGTC